MLISKIQVENSLPRLYVNGVRQVPSFFFTSSNPDYEGINRRQIKAAGEYGVHLHSTDCHLPICQPRGQRDFSHALHMLDLAIEEDPQTMILLRFSLSPTGGDAYDWGKTHPDDIMRYAYVHNAPYCNDMVNETSIIGTTPSAVTVASDDWLEATIDALHEFNDIVFCDAHYCDHLLGYHIGGGETGEWFHYGLRERGLDMSPANARQYRKYLKCLYGTIDVLELAWQVAPGSYVDFNDVHLPDDLPGNDRMIPAERTLFLEPGDQRFIDYCDYSSEIMVDRIAQLARACREMTRGEKLIVFFYGYLFELYDARTGHFQLNEVLNNPDIDAFTSPVSYTDRNHGGVGALMCPVDSILLHGKLWIVENDIRSPIVITQFGENKDWVEKVNSVENYNEVLTREMGQMLIHGLGCWYMDLACAGWQYHPLLWSRIHELHTLYDSVIGDLKPLQPDVAVVIDARAVSLVAHADAIGANVLYRMRLHFYRAGIKFGLYTSEDFEAGHVPSAKVVFYLTPFDISDERAEQLTLILRRQHSTLVLLHGPGRTSDESAKKLTGMNLVRMDGGQMELAMCAVPGFLTDGADFITEGDYNGLVQSANPAWYAQQNGRVRPLALYSKGPLAGKIATAYCEHDGFASVFTGALLLTSDAIREICRLGGAHIYSESGDTFFAGNGIYLLHTNKNTGVRTVTLPAPEHLMQFHGGYDSVVSLLPPVENPECPKNVYRTDGRATASYLWFDSARYSPAIPD